MHAVNDTSIKRRDSRQSESLFAHDISTSLFVCFQLYSELDQGLYNSSSLEVSAQVRVIRPTTSRGVWGEDEMRKKKENGSQLCVFLDTYLYRRFITGHT